MPKRGVQSRFAHPHATTLRRGLGWTTWLCAVAVSIEGLAGDLNVVPERILLDRPEASQQVLVTGSDTAGRAIDLTRRVQIEPADPAIVSVDARGRVTPRAEGVTTLRVTLDPAQSANGTQDPATTRDIPVEVRGLANPPRVSFEHEIIPILTKSRCNSGGCHGKAEGQNGFKLSVFGFDAPSDYDALSKETRFRRISTTAPERSLLLLKGSAAIPHGGGRKLDQDTIGYHRLLRWITEGAPWQGNAEPVVSIEVEPAEALLLPGESQQLRVTAVDAKGRRHCVTAEAEYETNFDLTARVDGSGLVETGNVAGEAAILIRYMDHVAVARMTMPRSGVHFDRPDEFSPIDAHVWNRLERLGIEPGGLADDATFLRRASLDVIGRLPTVDEARSFLADPRADKRTRLIDALLARDEYADFWAQQWADVLRVDRAKLAPAGVVAMTRWLKRQFAENRPFDEFVSEIVLAKGDALAESPAALYTSVEEPEVLARSVSQLFLGVRIECAQCHHHPFEKWGQDDYFGLVGFFTGVKKKSLPTGNPLVYTVPGNDVPNPRTQALVPTRALGAAPADFTHVSDRREPFADWLVSPDNPYFTRSICNRLWAHYFGRGLIEPIDDLRGTNPATNEPLLAELERQMHAVRFDLKAFQRILLTSRAYQSESHSTPGNADDDRNGSHALYRPMRAEVLLDAICDATGIQEKYAGWPLGYRAIEVWDNRLPSYFFRVFGRPVRATVCECERSSEPSIAQALHLINSPEMTDKIRAPEGRVAKLAASELHTARLVEELYLATLSREPTGPELHLAEAHFTESANPREAAEDLLWALLNSKEFLYNH